MRYLTFSETEQATYPICLLVPQIRKDEIRKAYVDTHSLDPNEILVIDLHYSETVKKTPVAEFKRYITEELVPVWTEMGTEFIVVTDAEYFKVLAGVTKSDVNLGYVLDCKFGDWKVIYVPSQKQIFYDPEKVRGKIAQGIDAMKAYRAGGYEAPGASIIKTAHYLSTPEEIEDWLVKLLDWDVPLTCDIECFSLKHNTAGIGTITFCWNKHEGIAFPVDLGPNPDLVRSMLKAFILQFRNKLIYHNAAFDVYVLIYQLFMKHILDTEGLLEGLDVMLRPGGWECTKLITYLATNSCAGNKLSLKEQAQEFAGNWAQEDIKDITKILLPDLLQYNLVDGLSTWFVYDKHWDTVVRDQQLSVYRDIFQPAIVDIVQMQLTGMPVDMQEVLRCEERLQADYDGAMATIEGSAVVQRFNYKLAEKRVEVMNATWKKKRTTISETLEEAKTNKGIQAEITFNPNSGPQLQNLLYGMLNLPVISLTDTKQPSTDGETIRALRNHTSNPDIIAFLDAMSDHAAVNKILTSFIPALKGAVQGPDGWHYLFGNFNLGGTISGRLSSSNPNLQNLPANGKSKKAQLYAKWIKKCFAPPPGWMFVGLDFASLEDRISAVTTKDPNKLKVYTDGYDGHSLRAYAYFGDTMPDIDPNSVESINSIQKLYKGERQESKTPTFLLTYAGTYKGMMEQCGFSTEKARLIEKRYHEMYVVSDQWVSAKLDEASRTGYVTVAFGLRLRTPKLAQVIRGTSKTPFEAEAEGRSAGNALGQSWCLLNSRAWSETMGKVRKSPYRTMIRPCAQIHDAGYALVKDDVGALLYLNKHLVKAVQWQEHPDIAHDEVKLGGELSIFYPNWSHEIGIPNGASEQDIYDIIDETLSAAA
jgi:DNA polymerase-1